VAANTLEGFGVLQVREELANEGKNHACFILVERRCQSSCIWSNICSPWET
jgi:hypothetical protein